MNPNITIILYFIYRCSHILPNCKICKLLSLFFLFISFSIAKYYITYCDLQQLLLCCLSSVYMVGLWKAWKEKKGHSCILLCWQYRSSSLRQMVITLVLRILPLQSWIWHFLSKSSPLHKQTAPLGAIKWNKEMTNLWTNIQLLNPPKVVSTVHVGTRRSKESFSIRPNWEFNVPVNKWLNQLTLMVIYLLDNIVKLLNNLDLLISVF